MIRIEPGPASVVITLGAIVFDGLQLDRRSGTLDEAMAAAEGAARLRAPARAA